MSAWRRCTGPVGSDAKNDNWVSATERWLSVCRLKARWISATLTVIPRTWTFRQMNCLGGIKTSKSLSVSDSEETAQRADIGHAWMLARWIYCWTPSGPVHARDWDVVETWSRHGQEQSGTSHHLGTVVDRSLLGLSTKISLIYNCGIWRFSYTRYRITFTLWYLTNQLLWSLSHRPRRLYRQLINCSCLLFLRSE